MSLYASLEPVIVTLIVGVCAIHAIRNLLPRRLAGRLARTALPAWIGKLLCRPSASVSDCQGECSHCSCSAPSGKTNDGAASGHRVIVIRLR